MEIIPKGGAALYAMQKALQQPERMLDVLQKNSKSDQLAAPPKSDVGDNEVAEMTGKGKNINITV